MGTIFMNSEKSKTFKSHFLVSKRTNKLDLRIGKKVIALVFILIIINLKYLHQHEMINSHCLMVRILCQIFKIILNTF